MHLTLERNIQIPGSFVVLQGIPGDGLLNTIDTAPDFDRQEKQQRQQQQQEEEEAHARDCHESQASNERNSHMATSTTSRPYFRAKPTFLGQGFFPGAPLLFSPIMSNDTYVRPLTSAHPMTRTDDSIRQPERSAPSTLVSSRGSGGDDFVLVDDDDDDNEDDREDAFKSRGSLVRNQAVDRAVAIWQEECVTIRTRLAAEWLEAAVLQCDQRGPTSRRPKPNPIPILSRIGTTACQRRWWIDSRNCQLRVFPSLPCPKPEKADDASLPQPLAIQQTLPPGTTLVGISLHTFDLIQTASPFYRSQNPRTRTNEPVIVPTGDHTNEIYKYVGECTSFDGRVTDSIPEEHCPRAGRIQYLHIESPVTGYVLFSVDGYPVLSPGLPSSSLFTGVLEHSSGSGSEPSKCCWWWKVTHHDGAVVRQGLDLNTQVVCVLPYGTHVQVLRKQISVVGLPRLLVRAQLYGQPPVQGWCSATLNPMAGQRGPILQPIPPAVPVWYQVQRSCTVRRDIELSSAVVRHLEIVGATVPILARCFTEFPVQQCLQRLQLAPQAYASLRLNIPCKNDEDADATQRILQPTGEIDGTFDPNSPGLYHWHQYLQWKQQTRSTWETSVGSNTSAFPLFGPTVPSVHPPGSATTGDLSSIEEKSSSSLGSSSNGSHTSSQPPKLCVCCQDRAPNATLVHGQTGHICCCLECARILEAQRIGCPICRLDIDNVILHFYS